VRPLGARVWEARAPRRSAEAQLERIRRGASRPAGEGAGDAAEQALRAAVPGDPQLSELLRQLDTVAAETGVQQSTITPSLPAALTGAVGSSVQVSLSASGATDAASAYLQGLSSLSRMFVVDQVSFRRAGGSAGVAAANGSGDGATGDDQVQLQLVGHVFTTQSATTSTTR
jgi:hypothetical protein